MFTNQSIIDECRFTELNNDARIYNTNADLIPSGIMRQQEIREQQLLIMGLLNATPREWNDWKWQLKNRIQHVSLLKEICRLSMVEAEYVSLVGQEYRWGISPYYASLAALDPKRNACYKQSVPDPRELIEGGELDPMHEKESSPVPCVTRRYPDRMIINATNQCAMYCRHCQRRRNIGEYDLHARMTNLKAALQYVADHSEIRDVLITGGDALLLSDKALNWILQELRIIKHVEIIRLGTRVPVTLPQRITPQLCQILKKYPPIYINTQFNHPLEVTEAARDACNRLFEAGAVLGNQAVLLNGINNDSVIMRKLNHELLKIRVRPYYIFHAKNVVGTKHLQTSIQCGIDIIKSLRGHTSGLAVPTFVVNAPGGLGKIAVMPETIVEATPKQVTLRTWEDRLVTIEEP
ncbi:MAG: KamA family radical SAM protein [Methylocystaceae bacterium]